MHNSKDTTSAARQPWERLGPVAPGGTVYGLAISPVRSVLGILVAPTPHVPLYWAVTSCGSFRSWTSGYHWDQYNDGLTTPLLTTVAVAHNGELFAGAADGSLFLSDDFGLSWEAGLVPPDLRAPVTAMVASPSFRRDQTVLAATDGAGVLASRDGGRKWHASSSHLDDRSVLALAVTPDWSKREIVFAGTPQGVYMSSSSGRLWHRTSLVLQDDAVDTLAVSPAFESDHTVYAGTEGGRLYCSNDGGTTWHLLHAAVGDGPVTSLWLARDFAESGRMVCGVGAAVYVSSDRGQSWRLAAKLPGAVLTLTGDERSVIVGLRDAGVWESRDAGSTWAPATGDLAARHFTWLKASGNRLYAVGPIEGMWASDDGGKSWACLPGLAAHVPLTAISVADDEPLLAASHNGDIVRSTDGGQTWHTVGHAPGVQSLLQVPTIPEAWAGTVHGELLISHDRGATWPDRTVPCPGQSIMAIAASPTFTRDHSLVLGTSGPSGVAMWHSLDAGTTWRQVAAHAVPAQRLDIAVLSGGHGNAVARALVAAGPHVLCPGGAHPGDWFAAPVDPGGTNVLSVVAASTADHGEQAFAAAGSGVFCSVDGGASWEPFMEGMEDRPMVSLALASGLDKYRLYALSLGGIVWRRDL